MSNNAINIDDFRIIENEITVKISDTLLNIEPGIHDISNENYHNSSGISRSALMKFNITPYHYWSYFVNPDRIIKKEEKDCLKIGEMIHLFLLEKDKFDEKYLLVKKMDKRTKAGQEYYKTLELIKGDKLLINQEEFEIVKNICDSLRKNKTAIEILEGAKIEKSFYWNDPHTGLLCKARPDIWQPNFIGDLKSTKSANFRDFQSSVFQYGYYLQCGFICEAFRNILNIDMRNFIFIAVEKEFPYSHAIYQLDGYALEQGISLFKNKLLELKQCYEKNVWPSYQTQIITLPSYAGVI